MTAISIPKHITSPNGAEQECIVENLRGRGWVDDDEVVTKLEITYRPSRSAVVTDIETRQRGAVGE